MYFVSKACGLVFFSAATAFAVSPAAYAQAGKNPVTEASDAFGFTNGDESVGIYTAQSVRGFNLEAAGNYRLNGRYFVKSSGVSNFFLDTTTVRIGYNTLGVDLPGPSGVVDFRLRDPARGEPSLLTIGLDAFSSPYVDAHYKYREEGNRFSASAGVGLVVDGHDEQGGEKSSWLLAGTLRANLSDQAKVQIFAGEYDYVRHGKFVVRTDGSFLPSRIERQKFLGQDWARERGQRRIAGVLYDQSLAPNWHLAATAVFSQEDPSRAYTQILTLEAPDALADNRIVAAPQQRFTAWSGDLKLGRNFNSGDIRQQLNLEARGRASRNSFGGEQVLVLDTPTFGMPGASVAAPEISSSADLSDRVDQWGVGLSYRLAWADKLKLTAGVLRSDYQKSFGSAADISTNKAAPWLYNLGVAGQVASKVELYGSYSRGLEEAGIAPANASNRNAVLNAVIVTQRELGLKVALQDTLSLVIAGFDTRKPYAGLDANSNIYGLVGTVRHRGMEASLSGEVAEGMSVVLGGVWIDAKLMGEAVQDGLIGDRPVGVPNARLIASVDYRLPGIEELSVDAGVTYESASAASTKIGEHGQLKVPSTTAVNLGMRYEFSFAHRPATLRVQMLNLLNSYSWDISSAETFSYSAPRRARLVLSTAF